MEAKFGDFFPRTTSPEGQLFIKTRESFKAKPYLDGGGVPTIGFGSTEYENGTAVKMTDPAITVDRALALFGSELKEYEAAVNKFIMLPVSQREFDAMVSLCYNIGIGQFKSSSVVKRINARESKERVADAFRMWKYDNGKVVQGLINRRELEIKLYLGK